MKKEQEYAVILLTNLLLTTDLSASMIIHPQLLDLELEEIVLRALKL